jgi:hypothetical protein
MPPYEHAEPDAPSESSIGGTCITRSKAFLSYGVTCVTTSFVSNVQARIAGFAVWAPLADWNAFISVKQLIMSNNPAI